MQILQKVPACLLSEDKAWQESLIQRAPARGKFSVGNLKRSLSDSHPKQTSGDPQWNTEKCFKVGCPDTLWLIGRILNGHT